MLSVKYYCLKLNITKMYLKSDLLPDVLWVYPVNSTDDSCCSAAFISLSTDINNTFSQFHQYV